MENKKSFMYSYYTIRKIIGFLGILLPIVIVVFNGKFLPSISAFYYSRSAVFFIAILSAFGLLLISYKGYERDKKTELLSDNMITHIGGFAALVVILIPTSFDFGLDKTVQCQLFGHCNKVYSTIHLISAGVFLTSMGWMAFFRFTKGEQTKGKRKKNIFYKSSGIIMWVSIVLLLIRFTTGCSVTEYDVYILETISVFAFGISWLIKGEAIKDIIELKNRVLKKNPKI